jgi:hypothetical protein
LTLPSADPTEAAPLALAVVLALLAAVTLELAAFLLTALAAGLFGIAPGLGMSITLSLGSVASWALAGAVAYEVARQRRAALAAATLPVIIACGIVAAAIVVSRESVDAGLLAGLLSGLVLGSAAYAGARLWERRIRRHDALQ